MSDKMLRICVDRMNFSVNVVWMIMIMIKSRRMRWARHVVPMREMSNAYKILVGKPEGKKSLGTPWHRWKDNIKMDIREIGFGGVKWIDLAQDKGWWWAPVNTVTNLWVQ
jgi:hypothetical protein